MNNKEILVSVCCVTYNHANFIRDAIEGFLMQKTKFGYEIIIHDDASTDGTTDIIIDYQKKYPEIIKPIIQKENQWSQGKRITPIAISKAKGKYIALCEGDDYWTDPLKLQKQVDFLQNNSEYSGSFHKTNVLADAENQTYGETEKKYFTVEDTISIKSPFHTSSFVFRNNLLEIPIWYKNIISGDMALYTIIASKGLLKPFNEMMSVYRKHLDGITNTSVVKNEFHQKRIQLWLKLDKYLQKKYHRNIREVINYHKAALKNQNKSHYWRAKNWLNKKLKGL